jgi:hypothetical protein
MNIKQTFLITLSLLALSVPQLQANVTLTIVTNPVDGGSVTGAGGYTNGASVFSDITAASDQYVANVSYNPGGTPIQFLVARVLYGDPTLITNISVSETLNSDTTLNVTFAPLYPVFTSLPASQTVLTGGTVTLSGGATGRQPIAYQWKRDGTNIDGATSASLTLTNAQAADAGNYTLMARNTFGITNSTSAMLSVEDMIVYANGEPVASNAVTVLGSANMGLQSRFAGGLIFYTLDGSAPDFASTPYAGAFGITSDCTLRAIAYSSDFSQSVEVGPIAFMVTPTFYLDAYAPGGGTIALDPPSYVYASNTTVKVTATPNVGWTFMGWSGDVSGKNFTNTIVMDGNKFIQAMFGTTVATTAAGNGTVSVSPDFSLHPYGSTVTITAIPNSGSYFALWGNAASGTMNPISYYVYQPTQTFSALFASLPTNQVTLTIKTDGGGYVATAWATNKYAIGSTNLLTAFPDIGQQFLNWSGDVSGNENPLPLALETNMVITAHFSRTPTLSMYAESSRMNLYVAGVAGSVYCLQSSTNLTDWTDIEAMTNYFGDTRQIVEPLNAHVPRQFYRAAAEK